ncbi:hypothetical protein J6590_083091 [Homalodisca vitripennis]|nr:hypothetical protein J6590_083091 [Homalodisca vitripennis]
MRQKTYYNNVLVRRTTPQLVSISIKQIKDLQGCNVEESDRTDTIYAAPLLPSGAGT